MKDKKRQRGSTSAGPKLRAQRSTLKAQRSALNAGSVLNINDRKEAEQEKNLLIEDLNRSHQYFRALFNWTPSAVGISTVAEGLLCDVNEGFSRLTGYTREELLGRTTLELGLWADPSQREIVLREIREQGFVHNREGLLRTKSGELRSLMVTVESIRLGSTPCLIYLAHDITERKQAEELRGRLAAMVEASDDAIIGTDVNGVITNWNQGAERLYGYAAQEAVGQSVTMIMPPDRLNESPDILARLTCGERVDHFETVRLHKNRSPVDISLTISPIKDAAGRVIGESRIGRDITERKQAEEALKQSEERFGSFVRSTDDGIVTLDRLGLIISWNPGAEKLFGYAQDEILGKPMTLLMPERFRERHARGIERASAVGHLTAAGSMFELVGLRKDGTEFPNEISVSSWSTRNGVFFTGIIRDITKRKRAEKILGESEERFRSLVGVITDVPWTADPKGQFVTPQEAYSRYTGASWEELRGRGWAQYIHPDDREQLVRSWKHAVATRAKYEASCREWHGPTQQWRRVIARGTPVFNLDGSVREWVGSLTDVNEKYEAEAALRASEERYRFATRATHDVIWDWDMVKDEVVWGEAMHRVFGHPPEQAGVVIHDAFEWWTAHIHPEDRERVGQSFKRATDLGSEEWYEEYRFLRADGTYAEIEDAAFIVYDAKNKPIRITGAMSDVTERRKSEQLEAQQKRVLALIAENAPLSTALEALVGMIEEQSAARMVASILLVQADGAHLYSAAAPSLPEAYNRAIDGIAIGPNAGSCGTAAYLRRPVYVSDIATDPLWADFAALALAHNLRACWSTPILSSAGRLLGTLALYYPEVREPNEHDLRLVEVAAGMAAIAIERKQAEETLRESEARFRMMADTAPVLIWMSGLDKLCVYFNQAWLGYTGRTMEQELGNGWADGVHPSDLDRCLKTYGEAFARRDPFEMEYRLRKADGQYGWVFDRGVPRCSPSGEFSGYIGSCIDITERKRAEEALRASEARYRGIVSQSVGGIAETDLTGRFTTVNDRYCEITGYSRDELVGRMLLKDMAHPDDLPHGLALLGQLIAEGTPFDIEKRYIRKDGSLVWAHNSVSVIRNAAGDAQSLVVVSIDISKRKRAEEERNRQELFISLMLNTGPGCLKRVAADGTLLQMNQAGLKLIEADREDAAIGLCVFDLVVPEHRPAFIDMHRDVLAGRSRTFQYEIQGLKRTRRWMETHAALFRNPVSGEGEHLAVTHDITERKRAEGRLRVTLDQVRALSGRLATAQEEERTRIARELHDELGVKLTCLKIDLSRVMSLVGNRVRADLRAKLNDRVRSMVEQVDSTIVSLQQLVTQLRPALLDDLGLVAAIEWQSQDFQKRTGIFCTCVTNADEIAMEPERATAVFRICQEALTNTARHAQATAAMITVTSKPDSLQMMVTDNGVGIPDTKISDRLSLGLLGMQERAAQCGGTVTIEGRPDKGTTVTVCLPVGEGQLES